MFNKLLALLKGWKTFLINTFSIWLSAILWVLPDILTHVTAFPVSQFVPTQYAPYVVLGLGLANLIVRKFTDGPPGKWAGAPKEDTDVLPT